MKKYIQLKDGVVFSTLHTAREVESNENILETQEENLDSLLNKKFENGSFVTISKTKYAIIANDRVKEIKETYFSSEVSGPIVDNDQVRIGWYSDGSTFAQYSPEELESLEAIAAAAAAAQP